jgi:hypothetical protein
MPVSSPMQFFQLQVRGFSSATHLHVGTLLLQSIFRLPIVCQKEIQYIPLSVARPLKFF